MAQLIKNKIAILVIAVILSLLVSYVRENAFLVINGIIDGNGSYKANIDSPEWLREQFNNRELLNLKWLLTFLFSLVFIAITVFTIHYIYEISIYTRILVIFYALLITAAMSLIITGFILGTYQQFFEHVRAIFGLIQSPLVLLMAVPLCFTANKLR